MSEAGSSELGAAHVSLGIDDSAVGSGLQRVSQMVMAGIGGLGGSVKGVLGAALGGITDPIAAIFGGGVGQISEWVDKAMQAERTTVKLEAVLRASGEAAGYSSERLNELADDLSKSTQASKGQVKESEAILIAMGDIRGVNFEETLKQATNVAAMMGTDMPAAAKHLGMALEHPANASRMLRSAMITLSDSEEAQVKQLMEMGDKAGAQSVILKAVGAHYGDMAEKMEQTTEGKIAKLSKTWSAMGTSIGGALLPAISTVSEVLKTGLDKVIQYGGQAWTWLDNKTNEIWASISSTVGDAWKQITDWFSNNETIQGWGEQMEDIWGNVKDYAADAWDFIKEGAEMAWEGIQSIWEGTVEFFQNMWTVISDATGVTWDDITGVVSSAFDKIRIFFADFKTSAKLTWDTIKFSAGTVVDGLIDLAQAWWAAWKAVFDSVVQLGSIFANNLKAIFSGDFGSYKGISTAMAEVSKAFEESMAKTMSGQNYGDSDFTKAARKAMQDDWDKLKQIDAEKQKQRAEDKANAGNQTTAEPAGEKEKKTGPDRPVKPLEAAPVKLEFSSIDEFAKKLQTSVTGGAVDTVDIQKATRDNTTRIADATEKIANSVSTGSGGAATFG